MIKDIKISSAFDFYLYGRRLQDIINPSLVKFSCLKINWSALENSIKHLLGVKKLWINLNFDAGRAFIFEDRKYNSLVEDNWPFWMQLTKLKITSEQYDTSECIRIVQLIVKILKKNDALKAELVLYFNHQIKPKY